MRTRMGLDKLGIEIQLRSRARNVLVASSSSAPTVTRWLAGSIFKNVERRGRADAEALALADGEVEDAVVTAEDFAG